MMMAWVSFNVRSEGRDKDTEIERESRAEKCCPVPEAWSIVQTQTVRLQTETLI